MALAAPYWTTALFPLAAPLPPLPVLNHLELFLRADVGVFADAGLTIPATNGAVVKGWQDQSGNSGRDATVSLGLNNPPVFTTGVTPTNKPGVRFFGAQGTNNQGQLQGALPGGGLGNARGYTYYMWLHELTVNAPKPISNTQQILACEVGSGVKLIPDDWSFSAGDNVASGVIGNPNFVGDQRWAVVYHGPTDGSAKLHELIVNGISVTNTTGLPMDLQTSYTLSGNSGGNVCFDGYLACLLVYTDTHTAAQVLQVVGWMTTVFG